MVKISRRKILKYTVGAGALLGGSFGAFKVYNKSSEVAVVHSKPLPIPPLLSGTKSDGQTVFNLSMQKGVSQFVVGKETATYGYNGTYLGPALVMNKGDDVVINVTNNLGESTTTHWHGLHLPARMDGGPYSVIENGDTWTAQFKIMNEASTYFYHPHLLHNTAEQVYRGLAGLFIIRDPGNEPDLPNQYGVDDIPLVVQDRSFNTDGSLRFSGEIEGVKGDKVLVNGGITPIFEAPAQFVRFRVLNVSNARIYNFGFSDNRKFYQVGTDGGSLESPVPLTKLLLAPAERAEILVDFSGQENQEVRLVSYSGEVASLSPFWMPDAQDNKTFDVLTINVKPATENAITTMPDRLSTIIPLQESQANVTRKLSLEFSIIGFKMTINGQSMDMNRIDQTVQLGDTEIWEFTNPSGMVHPFHIHDIQFQILSRNGELPPENERGWKDTVLVKQDETVRIIAKFDDFADPDIAYMYHCHILGHEDSGMMGQFLVV
ncbi:MAG: multicopper oxidase domain-containing protein [Rhodobacteraceae bacterium]|nr:multicopper oxidase domain-containing protein [Paracoccaceae bacterium]